MAGEDFIGSDLPAMTAEQEAAFAAEETAANTARTDTKGFNRLTAVVDEEGDGEPAAPAAPAAPVAPAAPAPAAPAAPAVDPDESDIMDAVLASDGKKYVPVATLVSTRKSLQGQLKDAQTLIEKGNERVNQLFELAAKHGAAPAAAPVAPPAPPAPETNPFDKSTHPLENLEWENQRLAKQVGELANWRTATTEQTQQQAALASARGAYVQLHRGFEGQNPAYASAYRHAMDTWTNVHKAMGMTHQEAVAKANEAEWAVVQEATKRNQHPSQVIMEIAKAAGWNPAAAAGGAAPVAPAPPTPAAVIKLAQEGAAAAVSLSDASGGSAPQPMTLSTLAAMSKEEFHAATTGQKGEELFRKMAMGPGRRGSAAA